MLSIWNNQKSYTTLFHFLTVNVVDLTRFQKLFLNLAICKRQNGESGNGMKGMIEMRGIQQIRVEMRGIDMGMPGIMVGMMRMRFGMQGIRVEMMVIR